MVRGKKSYSAEKSEQCTFLLDDIKSRQHLRDQELAKMIGIPLGTLYERKRDPGSFRLREIWNLVQAAGVNEERKQELL